MVADKIVIDNLPKYRKKDDCFSTEKFLYNLCRFQPEKLNNDQFFILDRLCKKIDVVKKVYIHYTKDLSRSLSNTPIDNEYDIALFNLLLYYAKSQNDSKFLNSALKQLDLMQNKIDKRMQSIFESRSLDLLNSLKISS